MDALSDVLRVTRLVGGVFLDAEFSDPWCLSSRPGPEICGPVVPKPTHLIPYHYVLEGRLRVKIGESEPSELEAGEVVLLPRNDPHLLGGDLSLTSTRADEVFRPSKSGGLASIRLGGGGERTRLVCGFLGCENVHGNPLLSGLPPVLRVDVRQGPAAEWIRSAFQFAAAEVAAGRAGSDTVLAKLSELLFVEAVRRYTDGLPPEQTGWLAGLKDPYVSRALALLHNRIDARWTVEELARAVGLSRSAIADRFTRLVGESPMRYLIRWRVQVAAQRLRASHRPLARIAEEIGYDSEAAFNRAFKRVFGMPPATWRRHAGDSESRSSETTASAEN